MNASRIVLDGKELTALSGLVERVETLVLFIRPTSRRANAKGRTLMVHEVREGESVERTPRRFTRLVARAGCKAATSAFPLSRCVCGSPRSLANCQPRRQA